MTAVIAENQIHIAAMITVFPKNVSNKGKSYAKQGHVLEYHLSRDDQAYLKINATVLGQAEKKYKVKIDVNKKEKTFFTDCSCPVGSSCKHCLAVLWVLDGIKPDIDPLTKPLAQPLDRTFNDWLGELANSVNSEKTEIVEKVIYCLTLKYESKIPVLSVQIGMSKPLKRGGLSKPKKFSLESARTNLRLTSRDYSLINQIITLPGNSGYWQGKETYALTGQEGAHLLSELIETGHCYWETMSQKTRLRLGEPQTARVQWDMTADGAQFVKLVSESIDENENIDEEKNKIYLPLIPIFYLDLNQKTVGLVKTDLPNPIVSQFIKMPPVPATQVLNFEKKIKTQLKNVNNFPLPKLFEDFEEKTMTPVPKLKIYKADMFIDSYFDYGEEGEESNYFVADCDMVYRDSDLNIETDFRMRSAHDLDYVQHVKEGKLLRFLRDKTAEAAHLKILEKMGIRTVDDMNSESETAFTERLLFNDNKLSEKDHEIFFIGDADSESDVTTIKQEFIPALQEKGWLVESDDETLGLDFVEIESWFSQLDESSEYDWFEFQLGIMVDGNTTNLLPMLIETIKQYPNKNSMPDKIVLRLPDNKRVSIDKTRMQSITDIIYQLCDPNRLSKKDFIKIDRSKAILLEDIKKAFSSTKLRWFGDDALLKLSKQLTNFKKIKSCKAPKDFKATLRNYQQDGLNWLSFLREYQLNGILADDMGLGKTLQVLALLTVEKKKKRLQAPCLVVAPTSVVPNWYREAEKFVPALRVLMLQGDQRKNHYDEIENYDLVLTSYALVVRDEAVLKKHHYYYVVLDEAQYIKNKQAKVTQIVQQLKADHRLCLTGTPVENNLGELWSQFNFLMPGLLDNHRTFKERFQTPIEKQADKNSQKKLTALTKPFLLRRTKQAVLTDLPEKTEIIKTIELSDAQRDLYETVRLAMNDKIKKAIENQGVERSQIVILDALLKLRQVCCHPQLLKLKAAESIHESTKLDSLLEMLQEMIQSGRKILLFSQFTGMLGLIEKALKESKQNYVKLTGSTRNRDEPIRQFQSSEVPLFLISLKAGGVGLNLTAADTVIHYDPWWNPAVENQATDRAHRMGQKNPVFVYKLISADTVEEKILAMQEKKRMIAEGLFEGNQDGNSAKLSKRDLEALFE